MAWPTSTFPTALDEITDIVDNVSEAKADDINGAYDAIEKLEAKVGIDSSAVATSLDYRVAALEVGANLAMTGEAEAHEHDSSTSLNLGSVTEGDRILVSAYAQATADSGLTTAVLAFGQTSGTAAIKFFNDLDNIGLRGVVEGGKAACMGGTFVAEVTTSGTLVLVSSAAIPGGVNTAITTYIYAVFLKKA